MKRLQRILRIGFPIAVGQLGVILMGFADTMMVGRYATSALGAAAFVNNIFNLLTMWLMGYSMGLTPLISESWGRGDLVGSVRALRGGLRAGSWCLLGVMAAALGVLCALPWLGQPVELVPLIRPYYIILWASLPFVMLFNTLRQLSDGACDTSAGMWALLCGNVWNVAGNFLLIYGVGPFPEMGLLGAGVATLTGRMLTAALLFVFIRWRRRYAAFREQWRGAVERVREEARRVNRLSLPVALQIGMETAAFSLSTVMVGWISATALAAYQILLTVGTLGFLFFYSFAGGMAIWVGTLRGRGEWDEAERSVRTGRGLLWALAVAAGGLFLLCGRGLVGLFTTDAAVVAVAMSAIVPMATYQLMDATQVTYANALRAVKYVRPIAPCAFVAYLLVNLPLGYLLGIHWAWGVRGIYVAFNVGLGLAAALYYAFYRRNRRKTCAKT